MKGEGPMKNWNLWLAALLVIVVVGGSFAYTAMTGTSTVTITGGGAEFSTVTSAGFTWATHPTGGRIGAVESGNLYTVARDSDYTGDLVFTLALTNADELINKYVYLNLEIRVMDGAEPSAEVTTEWLTLEEGVVELRVPAAKTAPFTVKINDGTYRTEPQTDPTAAPVFNIRVRQK